MRRSLRSVTVAASILVAVCGLPTAWAQGVTGSAVTGTIAGDGMGPLATAVIQLKNLATGDTFTAVSGPDGKYFIDNWVNARQDVLTRAPTSTTVPGRLRDGYELSNSGYGQANTTHTARLKLTSNWGNVSNELLTGFSSIRDNRDLSQILPLILVKVGTIGSADSWLAAGGERFSHQNLLDQDIFQLQDNVSFGFPDHRITFGTSNEFLRIKKYSSRPPTACGRSTVSMRSRRAPRAPSSGGSA
jgi:hypothetical protein